MNTTWRKEIESAMEEHGETWDDVEHYVMGENEEVCLWDDEDIPPASLDREFDNGLGVVNGDRFTLWTKNRVYYPCVYDGSELAGSVPRNPCDEATCHYGR